MTPPPRRFQFSLRTAFVGITILCLVMSWLAYHIKWVQARHAAKASIGYPAYVSIVARETLHPPLRAELPWGLRLFNEKPVPLIHTGVGSELSTAELRALFPEAQAVEISYDYVPEQSAPSDGK